MGGKPFACGGEHGGLVTMNVGALMPILSKPITSH